MSLIKKSKDVCYYAKVRILKQITTAKGGNVTCKRCLLLCKGKNFKANHNRSVAAISSKIDVCYYAKVRILKQITTKTLIIPKILPMFVIMQR